MATLDSKVPKGPIKDKWTDYKNHIDFFISGTVTMSGLGLIE